MERKLKELVRPDENALLDAVCGSAHQIWQAGLGAFARAQKDGGDLFDKLVQDGVELHKLTQRVTGDKRFSVTDTVTRLAESASRQASGSLDKLEKIFEERVSRSLRTLGVPAADEVQGLRRDIAELKAALHTLETRAHDDIDALKRSVAGQTAAGGAGGRKPALKKAAAKPAPKAAAQAAPAAAAKRAAAKPPAPRKTARSASRAS
jgi:poly(hydroxyalkanoate) granule-associated protein